LKYPVEILLGLAGIAAVAQPLIWPVAASGEAEKAKPAITAPQVERTIPPTIALAPAPPVEEAQRPRQAALTEDVWQPERTAPAAVTPKQIEKAVPENPAAFEKIPVSQKPRRAELERLAASYAKANDVPQALVHRVIMRESRYQPELIGHGGTIGLMQIKLATARGLGYTGDAEGLRDPDTNLTYGVKYLAGAYRVADGDHDRAVHYYAAGYYDAAKHWRLAHNSQSLPILASATPKQAALAESAKLVEDAKPVEAEKDAAAKPDPAAKPEPAAKPAEAAAKPKPKRIAAKPKGLLKLLADAKAEILRPPAAIPGGAKGAKPR
jgi:hypothetical protein